MITGIADIKRRCCTVGFCVVGGTRERCLEIDVTVAGGEQNRLHARGHHALPQSFDRVVLIGCEIFFNAVFR